MKAQTKRSGLWLMSAAVLLATAIVALLIVEPSATAKGDGSSATYTHGVLHVTIPYRTTHAGPGELMLEVVDPEDHVLGHVERAADVAEGRGRWQQEVKLDKPVALEDLVWHRLRYRFAYNGPKEGEAPTEGTDSISEILRTPVVHILGQQAYLTGGEAAVRVIVTDSKNEVIPGQGSVRIELLRDGHKPEALFSGRLNRRGTTEAAFRFPAGLAGSYQLHYVTDTAIGSTEFTQPVRIEDKVSILLTTEKPLYQPGQTIHVRALALDRANHEAAGNRKLTLEVEDSKGNKVFKKITQTSKFGIASAEFALADEVNLGTYHLRAILGDPDAGATSTAEIALNVQRYVLPKFKVAIDFGEKAGKSKHGYRPGDHVTGTVRANYFFGKPVEGEISVKASGMDVAVTELASAQGKTDHEGSYRFDLKLPTYFAGRPLEHGLARVLVEASVKDTAGHSESRGEPITVSEFPLIVTAVPEGGALARNLDNQVFILTSYADGAPVSAEVRVHAKGNADQQVTSDEGGVALIHINPGDGGSRLEVEVADKEGNRANTTVELPARDSQGDAQILLRTERAVYRAGEPIRLNVISTKKRGSAYIDVVKEGQTILTKDVDLEDGQAWLTLTATPEMAGTVDFSAYLFGQDARPVGDHRLIFVQPADDLKIEAVADAPMYKPGAEARIRFRVTNGRGEGVHAALGLQIVDEAVFALAEKQPGFAKVFFYLEQEVMKPRYEIHSIGMSDIVEPMEKAQADKRDRAARALFSATEMVSANKFETEFGRTVPTTKYADYAQRYHARFTEQAHKVAENLSRALASGRSRDFAKAIARATPVADAWQTDLKVETVAWNPQNYLLVRSAGPDKQFNTGDDMATYLEVRQKKIVGPPNSGPSSIAGEIEHDRGPFNGRAQIAGTAFDQQGGALEGVMVRARETTTGKTRTARVNAEGKFTFAGLEPGEYEITATNQKETAVRSFKLQARDRAVVSVRLKQDSGENIFALNSDLGLEFVVNEKAFDGLGRGRGGVIGGIAFNGAADMRVMKEEAMPMALPAPVAQTAPAKAANTATLAKDKADGPGGGGSGAEARVRSWFPEALYINPEIITDNEGRASIMVPMADSITTWRMAMIASTTHGALGTGTSSLKVFQDFFADLDLPVTLTQGDRVSIPVAVYNYSGSEGDVNLQLQADNWYALADDVPEKNVTVESSRVGGSQFTIEARRIGKFKLTLSARMKGAAGRADIIVREIEVIPNGREQNLVFNGRLETAVRHEVNFPATAVPDASKIFVRLYPGPLSQVIEGMDSILRMPGGCFEQTSSSTYPNVLALDYMKRTKKLTPEVHAKAEGFIANGYQRLLTFEVPGGGFSWFGNPPANKILTSYGLMEFYDMSKVYDVDPKLIARTQQWLAGQQQPDGSWKPDTSFINEGATNRYNSDVLRITAYIAWALENTGYKGPAVDKAKEFIEGHMGSKSRPDAYTLAVLANFAVDYEKDRDFTRQAMQALLDARTEKDEQAWWSADETAVYATGASASIETTGLAAQALLKWGQASGTARKAMTYIASKKDASGTWGTTQATIMALRALLLATEKGAGDVRGTVEVSINGKTMEKLTLTPDNNDLLHQFVFKGGDTKGATDVQIRFEGKGGLAYQVVGQYFMPWDQKPENEPLSIDVAYDRTRLSQDDVVTATATIRNNLPRSANMVMIDLGIPPGFELLSEDLQAYQEKSAGQKSGRLEKFTQTATQAILYFDSLAAHDSAKVTFRLRAKYPIRARTFKSRVYEYYDPAVQSVARPVQLEVKGK